MKFTEFTDIRQELSSAEGMPPPSLPTKEKPFIRISWIIITVLITATLTTIINIGINRFFVDKPNLVYTVNSIEINQIVYYQIMVKNNGNKEATEIKIDIPSTIDEFYNQKHYQTESVDIYGLNKSTQIIYSRLSPNGEFIITFIAPNKIQDTILIEYNGKTALNALDLENSLWNDPFFPFTLLASFMAILSTVLVYLRKKGKFIYGFVVEEKGLNERYE